MALAYILRKPFNRIEILKDENHSPYSFDENIKTNVSITHSGGMALSVVKDKAIDLELITNRNHVFIDESFSPVEVKKYELHKADNKLITVLWTMKEAHLKRMRIGLKTDLHGVIIDNLINKDKQKYTSLVISPQGRSVCEIYVGDDFVVSISSDDTIVLEK